MLEQSANTELNTAKCNFEDLYKKGNYLQAKVIPAHIFTKEPQPNLREFKKNSTNLLMAKWPDMKIYLLTMNEGAVKVLEMKTHIKKYGKPCSGVKTGNYQRIFYRQRKKMQEIVLATR